MAKREKETTLMLQPDPSLSKRNRRGSLEDPTSSSTPWKGGIVLDIAIENCSFARCPDTSPNGMKTEPFSIDPLTMLLGDDWKSTNIDPDTGKAIVPDDVPTSPHWPKPMVIIVPKDEDESTIEYNLEPPEDFIDDYVFKEECSEEDSGPDDDKEGVDNEGAEFLSRNIADPSPAVLPPHLPPAVFDRIKEVDAASDFALRQMATPDMLTFDWTSDFKAFQGVRETFTGAAGPTFPVSELQSPLDAFRKIWDDALIDLIVEQTNLYAEQMIPKDMDDKPHARSRNWVPTDRHEIMTFLAFLMYQSLVPLPVEQDYFKLTGTLAIPGLAKLMSYDRFLKLKKYLNFADSRAEPHDLTSQQRRLYKIQPVLDYVSDKFSNLYLPGQYVTIDESLLRWFGRISFSQKNCHKDATGGIKSYELCETTTGYLWKLFVYCGADRNDNRWTDPTDGQAACNGIEESGTTIIYNLVKPLLGKGHTLVLDNFYNSPLLARYLKARKTDVFGTLRLSREFVPDSLKTFTENELGIGELVSSQTHDLTAILWRDTTLVGMLSTYHRVETAAKEQFAYWRFKPRAIHDYHTQMGGVDKKDRRLSAYPLERSRNHKWYKKIFRRILNVSILNAFIIYRCKDGRILQREFRFQLAEALSVAYQQPRPAVWDVHCAPAKDRQILSGGHYIIKGPTRHATCVWCRRNGKSTRTVYKCDVCRVSLCLDFCFKEYHTVPD